MVGERKRSSDGKGASYSGGEAMKMDRNRRQSRRLQKIINKFCR